VVKLRRSNPFQHFLLFNPPRQPDPVPELLCVTHLESALIEVLILNDLKLTRMNTYEQYRGGGQLSAQDGSQGTQLGIPPVARPPGRPIAADDPRCNNGRRRSNLLHPGETSPLYPVSNRSERTSVTATVRRRPGLQVVPGSSVLTVDRSRVARISIQVIDAEEQRVGKAGSVRLG
jgi:hypothetical protein